MISFFLRKLGNTKNQYITQGVLSGIFLITGYFCYRHGIAAKGLNKFFSYYCLYYIGNLMREYRLMDVLSNMRSKYLILIAGFMLLILSIMTNNGISVEIAANYYMNPMVLLVASIVGWIMIFSAATILNKVGFVGNRMIVYISVHSMPIVGLHFLAFKFVNWIAVLVYGMDSFMIASFPVLMYGLWCIPYTIIGIAFPLLAEALFRRLKNICTWRLQNGD